MGRRFSISIDLDDISVTLMAGRWLVSINKAARHALIAALNRARFSWDVAFVGNREEKRERSLRAREGSGFDLALWGGARWRDRCRSCPLRSFSRERKAVGTDFRRAVGCTNVCIDLLRIQNDGGLTTLTFP